METKVVSINPKTAQEWLAKNDLNRPLKENLVRYLAMQIDKGLWRLNGETIILSKDGGLLDGQHRLHAIVKSGKTIKSNVCFGADESHFDSIDTGKQRDGYDVLAIKGFENAKRISSIVRAILEYKRGNMRAFGGKMGSGAGPKTRYSLPISNHDILEYAQKNYHTLDEIYQFSASLYQKVRMLSITQIAMFYFLFSISFLAIFCCLISARVLSKSKEIFILSYHC